MPIKIIGSAVEHAFADHYLYQANDFTFNDQLPIIMTEKDAVKCAAFADERYWYLRVTAMVPKLVYTSESSR